MLIEIQRSYRWKSLPMIRSLQPVLFVACTIAAMGAPSVLAQAGVAVPSDSPVYKAFTQLKNQSGYRMTMNLQANDARIARMTANGIGFSPIEKVVKGNVRQVTMHMRFPAADLPGTIDDWEIRAVVQNGHSARLITSPSVPRYLKLDDQMFQMQMAVLEQQASSILATAAADGPISTLRTVATAGQLSDGLVSLASLRRAHDFFSWQCMDQPIGQSTAKNDPDQLTDLNPVGDQAVEGKSASGYEFYIHNGDRFQGPIRLLIAKDSGLPLRIEMSDPRMNGSMHIDYDFNPTREIEIPACLGSGREKFLDGPLASW